MRLAELNTDLIKEHPDYVCRVTADEGHIGSAHRAKFQDVERHSPVILTTSHLLTTGVDAPTCKNVVLARVVGSMPEFKQIIGRGTRLRTDYGKLAFNIIDYTGTATEKFADPDFDGVPLHEQEDIIDREGKKVEVPQTREPEHAPYPPFPGPDETLPAGGLDDERRGPAPEVLRRRRRGRDREAPGLRARLGGQEARLPPAHRLHGRQGAHPVSERIRSSQGLAGPRAPGGDRRSPPGTGYRHGNSRRGRRQAGGGPLRPAVSPGLPCATPNPARTRRPLEAGRNSVPRAIRAGRARGSRRHAGQVRRARQRAVQAARHSGDSADLGMGERHRDLGQVRRRSDA